MYQYLYGGIEMISEKQRKINRNNRKRGSKFEKVVADYLGFEVVPYSGSNARFGYGDVRNDKWLIECKNITLDGDKLTIKQLWIEKNRERADNVGKMSAIAFMPAGKVDKFILIEYEDFSALGMKADYSHILKPKVHNTKNLIIHMSDLYIKDVRKGMVIELVLNDVSYFLMSIEKFKEAINEQGKE
jgi:hypothetical protein